MTEFFAAHPMIQISGLDNTGHTAGGESPIIAELVQGRLEELYWERVPEKIRRALVQKMIPNQTSAQVTTDTAKANGRRKRKR